MSERLPILAGLPEPHNGHLVLEPGGAIDFPVVGQAGQRGTHILPSELPAPSPDVVEAAHHQLPSNAGARMVARATAGQLNMLYGEAWSDAECLRLSGVLEREGYHVLITNFARQVMPAFYATVPHSVDRIGRHMGSYLVQMLIVTKAGRSNREWNDIHVPAPSFHSVRMPDGHFCLTPGLERPGVTTTAVMPAPLVIWNGEDAVQTQGIEDFLLGRWSNGISGMVDSGIMHNWSLLPAGANRATWQFEGLIYSAPPGAPDRHPIVAVWKLDMVYQGGGQTKLRVHFDSRLMPIQMEQGYQVVSRPTGQPPAQAVLQPPAQHGQVQGRR